MVELQQKSKLIKPSANSLPVDSCRDTMIAPFKKWGNILDKEVGPGCLVGGLELPRWWPHLPAHQRELDFRVVKLLRALPLAEVSRDCGSFDDLDAVMADPVSRSHLRVHLLNTTIQGSVTVLLVHVVVASPTLVSQPDSVVLDCSRVLLKYLLWVKWQINSEILKFKKKRQKESPCQAHRILFLWYWTLYYEELSRIKAIISAKSKGTKEGSSRYFEIKKLKHLKIIT